MADVGGSSPSRSTAEFMFSLGLRDDQSATIKNLYVNDFNHTELGPDKIQNKVRNDSTRADVEDAIERY